MIRNRGKTLVLGSYDDDYGKKYFHELQKYREKVSYAEYLIRHFSSGSTGIGESIPRLIDGVEIIDKIENKKSFLNPVNLVKEIRESDSVIVVYRGRNRDFWNAPKIHSDMSLLGYKLKDKSEGIEAEKVFGFFPDEPFVKSDKSEYRDKKTREIIWGEPAGIDAKRKILLMHFDKLATVCAHDSRKHDGWIVKKCPKGKRHLTTGRWQSLSKKYGKDGIETVADYKNRIYNIDVAEIFEDYIRELGERAPGTYLVKPDGSPLISDDVIDGEKILNGGTIQKYRDLAAEGQGDIEHLNRLGIDFKGKSVCLVDDRIMTGETMNDAKNVILDSGAYIVRMIAVHGEFHRLKTYPPDALSRLTERITVTGEPMRIHCTDTVWNERYDSRFSTLEKSVEVTHKIFR